MAKCGQRDPLDVVGDDEVPSLHQGVHFLDMNAYGVTPEAFMKGAVRSLDSDFMERKKASAAKKGRPIPEWKDEMEFLRDESANPTIAWPMRLFDCSPVSDGAAMLLLVSEDLAKRSSVSMSRNPSASLGQLEAPLSTP